MKMIRDLFIVCCVFLYIPFSFALRGAQGWEQDFYDTGGGDFSARSLPFLIVCVSLWAGSSYALHGWLDSFFGKYNDSWVPLALWGLWTILAAPVVAVLIATVLYKAIFLLVIGCFFFMALYHMLKEAKEADKANKPTAELEPVSRSTPNQLDRTKAKPRRNLSAVSKHRPDTKTVVKKLEPVRRWEQIVHLVDHAMSHSTHKYNDRERMLRKIKRAEGFWQLDESERDFIAEYVAENFREYSAGIDKAIDALVLFRSLWNGGYPHPGSATPELPPKPNANSRWSEADFLDFFSEEKEWQELNDHEKKIIANYIDDNFIAHTKKVTEATHRTGSAKKKTTGPIRLS